jgi:hypothetical protein
MAILAFAVTMCTSFTLFKGATHPDNRLSPAKVRFVITGGNFDCDRFADISIPTYPYTSTTHTQRNAVIRTWE